MTTAEPRQDQRLPRTRRILATRDFARIYAQGQRAGGKLITVVARRRREPGLRLGVSVSRQHGPAVRRNKIKRLLREAFRLERAGLPDGFDLILIPRVRESKLLLAPLRAELRELVQRIARKADAAPRRRSPEEP